MNKTVCAILLAAGSSLRMGADENGVAINKMLLDISGADPISRCAAAFDGLVQEMVIVVSEATRETAERAARLSRVPVRIVLGGARRQDSVLNGISATGCDIVAIHDCARCMVTGEVISAAIKSAAECGSGAAAVRVRDTIRRAETGETVDREGLVLMQTPQCFDRSMLLDAYAKAEGTFTDDAAVWRECYGSIALTEGSAANQKLTEYGDIAFFRRYTGGSRMRIGIGEDTHRLTEGRKLILGGVEIPFRLGLLGHSDADALIHAVIDAMLGAAALGDIGRHFPDKDPQYKDISSLVLLKKTGEMLEKNGYAVSNVDAVVTAQQPKLAPYIDEMRKNIADALPHAGIENVSVKATTPEGLGPEGNLESITARAVACIMPL